MSNKHIIQIDGDSTNKWITYNGSTLNLGSNQSGVDNILNVGPTVKTGNASSSTLNVNWSNTSSIYTGWTFNTDSNSSVIKGYDSTNGEYIRLSTEGSSYLTNGLGIGTPMNYDLNGDLQVNKINSDSKFEVLFAC